MVIVLRGGDPMYIDALQTEFSRFTAGQLHSAIKRLEQHPLQWMDTTDQGTTGHGTVLGGEPLPGVIIRNFGDRYTFRLTEVTGYLFSWDEFWMSAKSFPGFLAAMRDVLRTVPS